MNPNESQPQTPVERSERNTNPFSIAFITFLFLFALGWILRLCGFLQD